MNVLLESVRETTTKKSTRKRQCFHCLEQIEKGEDYINHQYRYDKTILSAFFHQECFKTFCVETTESHNIEPSTEEIKKETTIVRDMIIPPDVIIKYLKTQPYGSMRLENNPKGQKVLYIKKWWGIKQVILK